MKPRTSPEDTIIGATVREIRTSKGISQEALAGAIGVTFQQVQKYESGRNRIAATRLLQIASALDVTTEALLPRSTRSMAGASDPALDKELRELLRLYHRVDNPAQRHAVLKFLRRLAKA